MSLADIVNVTITRETTAITQAGFGTLLIAGPNVNTAARVTYYTTLAAVALALTNGSADPEYAAATAALSQNPRPVRVALGHVAGTKTITDDAGTYTAGSITITVNGTQIVEAFDTDKDTTLGNLATSIQALPSITTAVYSSVAHTIVITPATDEVVAVTELDVSAITGTMTVDLSATITENWDDALNNMNEENSDWYGIVITSRTEADVLEVAAWTETVDKVFFTASADSDIINVAESSATDIAKQLKDLSYARTACFYSSSAATSYLDAGVFGKIAPKDPGTYTVMFKTIAGIAVDSLTPTQSGNALAKNCNTYEEIGSVNIIREGTMAEGEYIDVIIFIDWLDARITENVFGTLARLDKLPYDDGGIGVIQSEVDKVLEIGQTRGGISPLAEDSTGNQIGGYVSSVPALEDISTNDKANRVLNGVEFTAWLSGAIHAVNINGVVTL